MHLPKVAQGELALRQRLSHYRQRYTWPGGELHITVDQPATTLDRVITLQWRGVSLTAYCNGSDLAHWLAPELQGAALFTLPSELALALLERSASPLPGLTCQGITQATPLAPGARLTVRLQRPDAALTLCLEEGEALLPLLAARGQHERLPLALPLSLCWGDIPLSVAELTSLVPGDVLLYPEGMNPQAPLRGCAAGRTFGLFQLNGNQLECLTMDHTDADIGHDTAHDLDTLPLPVSVEVGRQTLEWHTLTSLEPGAVIDLDTPVEGEVRLLVHGRQVASGRLVEIQGRLGVRIERLTEVPTP